MPLTWEQWPPPVKPVVEAFRSPPGAARVLEQNVVVEQVVPGAGRGRSLNCPTANLELENEVQAKSGVYITEARVIATRFPSVSNVGVRPTFDGDTTTVETHLLDFHEDLYRERLELRFLERLRDEIRFDSAEDLADQLSRDRAAATAFFQHQPIRS